MAQQRRIAYLLSQYPAVSHTFFLNEVVALRERGLHIETASINRIAPPADGFSPRELLESSQTFCVKAMPRTAAARRLIAIAIAHPVVLLRGLRVALSLAPGDLHGTIYALFYLMEALLVGAWMRDRRCGHLHVHFGGPVATVALLVSHAWDVPYSITIHGPDELFDMDRFYLRRKMERARFVVCISHFCRSQLLRISHPSTWPKFHVCRLGVDDALFVPTARSAPEPQTDARPTPFRILCVGRLSPSKGQAILLQAIARLKHRGIRVQLDLVGGGEDRVSLEQIIRAQGLEREVTLHGATSHARTRSLLGLGDLFVLPSFAEGVPVALMEAMAMEIACISTFVAGIPELIRSGVDGLLVSPSSVEELSEAIAQMIHHPARRMALASAGRARVLANYHLGRNADRLATIFERNCNSTPEVTPA